MISWPAPDWHDPIVLAFTALVVLVALFRRWGVVLVAALVVAAGEGLDYLLRRGSLDPALASNLVLALYVVGAALVVLLVAARWIGRRE